MKDRCALGAERARRSPPVITSVMLAKPIFVVAAIVSAGMYARSEATAQTPAGGPPQNTCTYAACALRLEPRFFAPQRLVRGATGETVRLGAWGQDAMPLFGQSDSAATYGARYVRAFRQTAVMSGLAVIVSTVAVVRSQRGRDDTANAILVATGAGFVLVSIPLQIRSDKHLSRAIWWYNSTLPR